MPSKEDEIRKIKEKISELDRLESKENEDIKEIDFVVRFKNLSPALKTITIFSWVIAIYLLIFFIAGFIAGIYG